jgi:hypothetical protein
MSISQDQRIQLLLIGFAFNGFLEGAAGQNQLIVIEYVGLERYS